MDLTPFDLLIIAFATCFCTDVTSHTGIPANTTREVNVSRCRLSNGNQGLFVKVKNGSKRYLQYHQ